MDSFETPARQPLALRRGMPMPPEVAARAAEDRSAVQPRLYNSAMPELTELKSQGDSCFTGLPFVEIDRLLGRLNIHRRHDFTPVAAELAALLGLPLPLPRLSESERSSITIRLSGGLAEPVALVELLALLHDVGETGCKAEAIKIFPGDAENWLNTLQRAVGSHAAGSASMPAGDMQAKIRRSPLWLELDGRPEALIRVLHYAYGGHRGAHDLRYDALCAELDPAMGRLGQPAQCLKDMLLQALLASSAGERFASLALDQVFSAQRTGRGTGALPQAGFEAYMHAALGKARAATWTMPLTAVHAAIRRQLAEYGVPGVAQQMPAELVVNPEVTDGRALDWASDLRALCDTKLPSGELRLAALDLAGDFLRNLWLEDWPLDTTQPAARVEQTLKGLRAAAWVLGAVAERAVAASDLSPASGAQVLRSVHYAVEDKIATASWGQDLSITDGPRRPEHHETAKHWCRVLTAWRHAPGQRDALANDAAIWLPKPALALLAAEPDLAARDLKTIFDRCLSSRLIETFERSFLAQGLAEQIDRSLIEALGSRIARTLLSEAASGQGPA